jgi:hypothetical protein
LFSLYDFWKSGCVGFHGFLRYQNVSHIWHTFSPGMFPLIKLFSLYGFGKSVLLLLEFGILLADQSDVSHIRYYCRFLADYA